MERRGRFIGKWNVGARFIAPTRIMLLNRIIVPIALNLSSYGSLHVVMLENTMLSLLFEMDLFWHNNRL